MEQEARIGPGPGGTPARWSSPFGSRATPLRGRLYLITSWPKRTSMEGSEGSDEGGPEERGGGERLRYFIRMLGEEDPARRWKAAEVLARIRDPDGVEPLIGALQDQDWRVRQKAAWALGMIGDPRALVPLRRAMMHEREGVKEIIEEALDAITGAMYR